MVAIEVGTQAPAFTLKSAGGKDVSLSELLKQGRNIIIAFYPAAWTSVCGSEMTLYQEMLDHFKQLNATVVGISEDNVPSITAWCERKGITFTMLSDFNPRGEVATKYGVLRDDGMAERALFIVAPNGIVRYSYVSPIGVNPGADRLFDALEQIESSVKA